MCWCCWRKIIKISPCLSKLELAKVGAFSETQCSEKWASPVEFSWHGDVCCQYILRYIYNSRVLTVICICFSSIHFKSMFVVYCHCYKKLRTYHCGVMTCSVDAEWSDDFDRQTCVCVCVSRVCWSVCLYVCLCCLVHLSVVLVSASSVSQKPTVTRTGVYCMVHSCQRSALLSLLVLCVCVLCVFINYGTASLLLAGWLACLAMLPMSICLSVVCPSVLLSYPERSKIDS